MPTFNVYVRVEDGSYQKDAKQYEEPNRTKAAAAYFADNPDEAGEVDVVNAAQSETFRQTRKIESVSAPERKRRQRKPDAAPAPADNSGVSDDAKDKSPFGAKGDDPDPSPDPDPDPAQDGGSSSDDDVRGFGSRD